MLELTNDERAYICNIAYILDGDVRVDRLQSLYDYLADRYVVDVTRESCSLLSDKQYKHLADLLRNHKDFNGYIKRRLTKEQQNQAIAAIDEHDKSVAKYRIIRDKAEDLFQKYVVASWKYYHSRRCKRRCKIASKGVSNQLHVEKHL